MIFKSHKILTILMVLVLSACARRGSPGGGPKDTTPPQLLRAVPDTMSVNVPIDIKEIELDFDEYIKLKNSQDILISPPVSSGTMFMPQGTAAKKVQVKFDTLLRKNTTYTINFGNSIEDNNEGNPLSYFTYVFSTGPVLDSLEIKGRINAPGDKTPGEDVVAALYKVDSAYTDSLILKQQPYYIANIDSVGRFELKHLHEGKYRLLAFEDSSPNLKIDIKTEKIAFVDSIITAGSSQKYEMDLFQSRQAYRAIEAEQIEAGHIDFVFSGQPEQVEVVALNEETPQGRTIHKPYSDTLQYYFKPELDSAKKKKRLRFKFAVRHKEQLDTIPPVLYDNQKEAKLSLAAQSANYAPGKIYQINANYPLDTIQKEMISVHNDTIPIDFTIKRVNEKRFAVDFPLEFNQKYKIEMLPNAVTDFMGNTNDTLQLSINIKDQKEYGNLILKIKNPPTAPFWLKLYKGEDKEITSVYGREANQTFGNLLPGDYYFKLIVDSNENGRWDTGNFFERKQPEPIFLYPTKVNVRAYWDMEEVWDLASSPENVSEEEKQKTQEVREKISDLKNRKPTK